MSYAPALNRLSIKVATVTDYDNRDCYAFAGLHKDMAGCTSIFVDSANGGGRWAADILASRIVFGAVTWADVPTRACVPHDSAPSMVHNADNATISPWALRVM